MDASNRISLAALAVSPVSLLISLGRDGARPAVPVSRNLSTMVGFDEYEVRVSNAGAGAMFDVGLTMDGCDRPARIPRLESGGVWTVVMDFGVDDGDWREPEEEPGPLPDYVGRATLRYRAMPFPRWRRRRVWRSAALARHHGPMRI
ncbi:hypothetical protein [Bifidobacterium myosotis]|uniref:Uncharacterized protein n=1 Tax=Bifidobacterium myosotis TaxID=1630166 RepID=A0A5M9ZHJ4_9BIFI|nr:hypothetical protein [Bifidobacterium myosotis]KAA8826929.1 hypothetical protein EMO91_10380 [Bifidobacterium myosotis]